MKVVGFLIKYYLPNYTFNKKINLLFERKLLIRALRNNP